MEPIAEEPKLDVPLRSVGFLRRGEPFDVGEVDVAVFEKLCELTQNAWIVMPTAGCHLCDLCRFTGNSSALFQRKAGDPGLPVFAYSSCGPTAIPGDGLIYLVPTNVTHYIDAHEYRPPDSFCEAVLRCPPMRSMEYWKAVLANGGRPLVAAYREGQES